MTATKRPYNLSVPCDGHSNCHWASVSGVFTYISLQSLGRFVRLFKPTQSSLDSFRVKAAAQLHQLAVAESMHLLQRGMHLLLCMKRRF